MNRKVFISFLGTTDYLNCCYYPEQSPENKLPLEKYVQVSLIESLRDVLTENDAVFIFLTKEAEKKNWNDNGHLNRQTGEQKSNDGLHFRLKKMQASGELRASVNPITDVPEGFSSKEIWQIFKKVHEVLQLGDEVYLDITHAFRYIPMLALSLMHYEQFVTQITLKAVYYGAFEKLGPPNQVAEMEEKERMAPILNLQSMAALQNWTNATHDFISSGKMNLLESLTNKEIDNLGIKKNRSDVNADLNKMISGLKTISQNLYTNRGIQILNKFGYQDAAEKIGRLFESGSLVEPVNGLLSSINIKLEQLSNPAYPSWLNAAIWCLNHDLIQQGITQFQEGCISFALQQVPGSYRLEFSNQDHRKLATHALYYCNRKIRDNKALWRESRADDIQVIEHILSITNLKILADSYSLITESRNDINHCGYVKVPKQPENFKKDLSKAIEKGKSFFVNTDFSERAIYSKQKKFINISNHPLSDWSQQQLRAAKYFGEPVDMPFPQIDPVASTAELQIVADGYLDIISKENKEFELTVHIMGEQVFCFLLVTKFKDAGIKTVASTTQRLVTTDENGVKKSEFEFVQFREY